MKSLGVIGGLGPMASAYFLERLIDMTDAKTDQDHLDVILFDRPAVPDRTAYLLGKGESPLPRMQETARTLESLGASCVAIPCVTSHALYGELAAAVAVPILHMVEETAAYLKRAGIHKAGILATDGTVRTRLFQDALARHGITWAVPDEAGQRRVMELIYGQVKAGLPADPALFEAAAQPLREEGCGCVILGCTELSLLKRDHALGDGVLDTLEVLAAAALRDCGAPRKAAFADLLAPRPPRRG